MKKKRRTGACFTLTTLRKLNSFGFGLAVKENGTSETRPRCFTKLFINPRCQSDAENADKKKI